MPDLADIRSPAYNDRRTHSRATLEWVCRAQDARCNPNDNGLAAAGFDFEGWLIYNRTPRIFDAPRRSDTAGVAIPRRGR